MAKLNDRIASIEARLKQLKVQQQHAASRHRALESKRTRKADTRRKILVGSIVLAKLDQGEFDQAQLNRWLEESLTRADDRALFGLLNHDELAPAGGMKNLPERDRAT